MDSFKIVNTDNFGGDYPNEKFVEGLGSLTEQEAKFIAEAINKTLCLGDYASRFWKVVPSNYVLQTGFEP